MLSELSDTHVFSEAHLATQPAMVLDRRMYSLAKRVLDLAVCLSILIVVLLVMAVIAVAVLLDSPGPILFVQERVGQGGRRFRMYKFRTMRHDYNADASREFMQAFVAGQITDHAGNAQGTVFKPIHKSQVTRLGRILRQTSLDELPQIYNVLRGEMSLVGPRPNIPWEVEAYQDWHRQRLNARPGITGLAQVYGRSSISFDAIVKYDIEYIRRQSIKLDVQILWLTVKSVLTGRGAG
ncbi:MAG TPA: sugar transferase [Anaerolineae bacterium]|nr:sugar transferase [Anaerolineae bacterium]